MKKNDIESLRECLKSQKAEIKQTEKESVVIRHDGRRYPRKPEIKQYAVWTEFQKFTRHILEHDI